MVGRRSIVVLGTVMKFHVLRNMLFVVFALCAGAAWIGWMPIVWAGVVGLIVLGVFAFDWRTRVARNKVDQLEEMLRIAKHAPEMRGMEDDFLGQAEYAKKAVNAFKRTASKEDVKLYEEAYRREIDKWLYRHDGEPARPWLAVATLRRVEAEIRAAKKDAPEKREQRSAPPL